MKHRLMQINFISMATGAGTRLRNALQQIKKIAQEIRIEVGELKKQKN